MAAKRKKKKGTRSHRRRHRVSGIHPGLAQAGMMVAGAGVGAIAEVFINQAIKTSFPTMPGWIGGGAGVAGGAALILFAPESPFVTGAAAGMAAAGAIFATNETFISLPGISGIPKGVPNAMPGQGFLSKSVGTYKGIPQNFIGNLSGPNGKVVGQIGALYRN